MEAGGREVTVFIGFGFFVLIEFAMSKRKVQTLVFVSIKFSNKIKIFVRRELCVAQNLCFHICLNFIFGTNSEDRWWWWSTLPWHWL